MRTFFLFLFIAIPAVCLSQEIAADSDTIRKDALNVFIPGADSYIKKEITFINYVRDLKSADLYIIISFQDTGSGGAAVTCFLVGQNRFEGMNDTVVINFSPDETDDVTRTKSVDILKMALMRYMLKTPLANYFKVSFTVPVKETVATDKWNSWVFRTDFSGSIRREKSYRSMNLYGGIEINRITEQNKFLFDYSYSWDDSWYQYGVTRIKSFSRSHYASMEYVYGLGDHWSLGGFGAASSSVYSNYDLYLSLKPAIEYDFFPYAESTRRILTVNYKIGPEYYNYHDTTLYDKVKETLYSHSLNWTLSLIEKWGNATFRITYMNFLHDWSKNLVNAGAYFSVRLAKGLNIYFSGGGSIIHNQLSLPRGEASLEEVLLRRKQIATSYSAYGRFGISYTFGSIYNNAVNPRFGGGGYYFF